MSTPFRLAQISDPHIGATWAGGDPAAGLAATIEEIRRLPDRPHAVLISGDLADNAADAEYEVVRQLVTGIDAPAYVLPGNHDDRDAMRRCFGLPGSNGAPIQYSADLGPLRLVVLDSTRPGEDPGELDRERLAWLDTELAADPDRPAIVAMHHPPLLMGSSAWDKFGLPSSDRAALAEIVGRNPQVQRIVAGHVHRPITADLAGSAVLTVPSTYVQARLDLSSDQMSFVHEPPAFAVHVLVDGELTSHIQPVARSDRDLG